MDSPNISIRIRRHESLPCHGFHRTLVHSSTNTSNGQNNNRAFGKASILIGRRLGATKNNPYVGSFRHAPPTSLYSMAASSLPSLSSMKEADFSSLFLSPSFAFAANSPYVGWFRHAPPVFSSQKYLDTNNNKTDSKRKAKTKSQKTSLIVQHKVNPDSLLEVDRWHHQLTSLLLGANKEETEKAPPLLLRQIINGRLLGGSGKDDRRIVGCNSSNDNIIARCNRMYQHNNTSRVPPLRLSSTSEAIHHPGYKNSVLSRLKSWLLFPLIYTGDECYDEYGCYKDNYGSKKTMSGLKLLPSRPKNERSIEIDSDENDYDDDYSSSSSSVDYDHCGKDSVREGLSPEMEREFSTEANLSVSEIAEAYYAHQLLDERRHRSNSDVSTVSQQSGLSPSSLHHTTDYNGEEEARERLDYEITQMDIARMTRNASRHLDVSSILHLPTITYQKRRPTPPSSPNNGRNKQNIPQCEQSYLQVCTPIHEDRSHAITQGSCIVNIKGQGNDKSILSEDGWSFMMVSDMKPSPINNSMGKSSANLIDDGEDNTATGTSSTDDMCVICLEPFREGDRLRVLPCDHSFHVGCIDRWLSGSHSHNECFTSGCPTCKKRPSIQSSSPPSLQVLTLETIHNNDDDISGSLPSWAFANLGSVMAMSSGDILDGI